jgi:hypothetical protein
VDYDIVRSWRFAWPFRTSTLNKEVRCSFEALITISETFKCVITELTSGICLQRMREREREESWGGRGSERHYRLEGGVTET